MSRIAPMRYNLLFYRRTVLRIMIRALFKLSPFQATHAHLNCYHKRMGGVEELPEAHIFLTCAA